MSGSILSVVDERPGADPNFRLDVGSVFARTFAVWGSNLLPFCLLGLIVEAPVLLTLGALALTGTSLPLLQRGLEVVSNLLAIVLTGGVTYGVFQALRGSRPTLGEVLRLGVSRVGTVFFTGLLTGLAVFLGFCALVIPGLILMTWFWVAVPAAVIESPGAGDAMSRSKELTEGNRWRVFALAFIMGAVTLVVSLVLGVVIALLGHPVASEGVSPAWAQGLLGLAIIPVQALAAVAPAVAYHDLRVGREGVDIDELLKVFE